MSCLCIRCTEAIAGVPEILGCTDDEILYDHGRFHPAESRAFVEFHERSVVGGDEGAFAKAETVMSGYAARMTLMGESGAGQITKMTNQICVVGVCHSLYGRMRYASCRRY